jgi:hypothetical protein
MNVSLLPLRLKVWDALYSADAQNSSIVKLIFSILFSYPLAGLLKRVPDTKPAYKNLFNAAYVLSESNKETGQTSRRTA